MSPEIGGYREHTDWPKLRPSMLIATCLILAIRTAKWRPEYDEKTCMYELNKEIDYAAFLADRVLMHLLSKNEGMFPSRREPWYQQEEDESPR